MFNPDRALVKGLLAQGFRVIGVQTSVSEPHHLFHGLRIVMAPNDKFDMDALLRQCAHAGAGLSENGWITTVHPMTVEFQDDRQEEDVVAFCAAKGTHLGLLTEWLAVGWDTTIPSDAFRDDWLN